MPAKGIRYIADKLPTRWEDAREVLDEGIRAIRSVLDGGWKYREQIRNLVDTEIDTGALPVSVSFPSLSSPPMTVQCLRAVELRTETGIVLSALPVRWEFRSGTLFIHEITGLSASTRYRVTLAAMD